MESTHETHLKELSTILDEYTAWFMQVIRVVTYPGDQRRAQIMPPKSFEIWSERASKAGLEVAVIMHLTQLHNDLGTQAERLIDEVHTKEAPEYKHFDNLITLFEEFILHVRRLERDCLLENSGIDTLTGLRSASILEKDMKIELERLDRQGKPFIVALVRMDHLEKLKKDADASKIEKYVQLVARLIKKSIRSFDDAYRLENGEFVLTLKQTEMQGGVRALERLKKELEAHIATLEGKGDAKAISLSSCLASPMPGDNVKELLRNLRTDLHTTTKSEGAVLQYFEMSPLERFVRNGKD